MTHSSLAKANIKDPNILPWLIVLIHLDLLNALDHIDAGLDLAEHHVLPIESGRGDGGDEKLTSVRVRPCIGHAHRERLGVVQARVELVLEIATPKTLSARAISQRVAGLDNKLFDDPMEDDAVVVPLLCQA